MSPRSADPRADRGDRDSFPVDLENGSEASTGPRAGDRPAWVPGWADPRRQQAQQSKREGAARSGEGDDFAAATLGPGDALPASTAERRTSVAGVDEASLQARIARIVHQDEHALAELYDALAGRVYGLALRITRQVQTAEEVTEDAFWQVWRQAPRFDPTRGSVLSWILTIARSRALDALRRRDQAEALDERCLADLEAGSNPQDLLQAVQQHHRLHAALARLDALPRQLLALAFFRGLSHEEIACQMKLPLGTVKSHIRRALLRLRELLGSNDPTSPMVTP